MAKSDEAQSGANGEGQKAADITQQQFVELQKLLAESNKTMQQQAKLLAEQNEANKQLSGRLAKLEENQVNATPVGKQPKFIPAKKFETSVNGVKVKFRKVFVDRGEVIIPTSEEGRAVIRVRIDEVIDDTKIMQFIYDTEKANLAKGKAIGYLELVK